MPQRVDQRVESSSSMSIEYRVSRLFFSRSSIIEYPIFNIPYQMIINHKSHTFVLSILRSASWRFPTLKVRYRTTHDDDQTRSHTFTRIRLNRIVLGVGSETGEGGPLAGARALGLGSSGAASWGEEAKSVERAGSGGEVPSGTWSGTWRGTWDQVPPAVRTPSKVKA
jgi:hypothetical protein